LALREQFKFDKETYTYRHFFRKQSIKVQDVRNVQINLDSLGTVKKVIFYDKNGKKAISFFDNGRAFIDGVFISTDASLDGEHTIEAFYLMEEIHQIDEKYIPDTIASLTDVPELPDIPALTWDNITNKPSIVKGTDIKAVILGGGAEASGPYSLAEGKDTIASGPYSHAEGKDTIASGSNSHAEGNGTVAFRGQAHAEGNKTTASGNAAHAEGSSSTALAASAHAEGNFTTASGESAHAEGWKNSATNIGSHAEGGFYKIVDDELFFDLEEVEINYECGPEVLSNYEGTTIEDILSDYWKSHVKKCLECMLEYMHNDEVIELNNESKEN
jgi:hypothetical protein